MKIWFKRIIYTLISLILVFMYIGYSHNQKQKNNDPTKVVEQKKQSENSKMEQILTNYHICDLALRKADRGRSFEEGLSWYSDYENDKTKDSYYSHLPNGILVVISARAGMGYRCTHDKEIIRVDFLRNIQSFNDGYEYSIDSRMTSKFNTKDIWTPEMKKIIRDHINKNKK